MIHLGLFAGIGGFELAAKWMGWKTLAWCECNEFGQKVLRYHFPEAEGFGDITKTDFKKYANRIDVLTGGFPCQPYSTAGKRLGTEDDRHLWPEMLRAIREVQPCYVVGENVRGLTNWKGGLVFDQVQADLENEGYEVLPFLLPACAVNAPHRRDRIWFVAHASENGSHGSKNRSGNTKGNYNNQTGAHTVEQLAGCSSQAARKTVTSPTGIGERSGAESKGGNDRGWQFMAGSESGRNNNDNGEGRIITNPSGQRLPFTTRGEQRKVSSQATGTTRSKLGGAFTEVAGWEGFPTQSPLRERNDGFPTELVGITISKHRNESLKGYGNAIVPQIALMIFKSIKEYEKLQSL